MAFGGFGKDTFSFLADLKANNNGAWFKTPANQARYKASVGAPSKAFVTAIGERLDAVTSERWRIGHMASSKRTDGSRSRRIGSPDQ